MDPPSLRRSPVVPALLAFSDPARSICCYHTTEGEGEEEGEFVLVSSVDDLTRARVCVCVCV